ncbi:MAG: polysaccharide pyruvyl transferase family protein [Ruminococcaceae bacterium]|nr:polysaccharide pyruvyl transferase family protein [Oscillospiraceae bacterium]
MEKKVGILTMYYNSVNYGGLLQAYALCKALNCTGIVKSEQIQYSDKRFKYKLIGYVRSCQYKLKNAKLYFKYGLAFSNKNKKRKKKIFEFATKYIPHTKKVFNKKSITMTNELFESFICGSDQVWCSRDGRYYLDFVQAKNKYAYACSTGKMTYNQHEKELFERHLQDFQAISVREKDLSSYLTDILNKEVECVLDPTLLLEKEQWDTVCAERIIKENYVFCYFLGSDVNHRKLATEYAKNKGLKLVTLPHLQQKINKSDIGFGDYQLFEIDPKDFISLIKNAECVLTDSFHASVFSCIYEKKFFVFERTDHKGMSSRISTLVDLFGCYNQFCDDNEKLSFDYMASTEICYNKEKYKKAHEESMLFIKKQILGECIDEK